MKKKFSARKLTLKKAKIANNISSLLMTIQNKIMVTKITIFFSFVLQKKAFSPVFLYFCFVFVIQVIRSCNITFNSFFL